MITDTHINVVPPRVAGVGPLDPRLDGPPEAVAQLLRQELDEAGVRRCVAVGAFPGHDDDPLGVAGTLRVADFVPGMFAAGVCDPSRCDPEQIRRCERALSGGRVRALMVYLGYLPFPANHANYRPYYELAGRAGVPVIVHAGEPQSPYARLRESHPLAVDDVAVDHPGTKFVIARAGGPWFADTAAVVAKNVNVWADLSALIPTNRWNAADDETAQLLDDVRSDLTKAFRYAGRPNRFLFASGWPRVDLPAYRDLVGGWFPDHIHDLLFDENARLLFRF